MIKISTNKMGNVYIKSSFLKDVIKSIIIQYINEKKIIDIDFDIKRNSLKLINIKLIKENNWSREEQKNLIDDISFTLSSKYQITNKVITFMYEN
ncbi:MAG: hypothetical protein HDR31_00380 [Mycoplasma sp.]|nr:hypothetical protein [Mycoplasma sp.]